MSPALVLVGTPIGNLGDLSSRAVAELGAVDAIACEDTRRTGKLLELAGIARRGPLIVLNDHTEERRAAEIIERIVHGERVALVSDAGMPGISDPGQRLVAAAHDAGVPVEVVPGPSAAITALVLSGLPAGRFTFEGFLPRKGKARRARLEAIARDERTAVIYESPHRVADTLADLREVAGADRAVAVARELTKLYEEVWRGPVGEAHDVFVETPPRGEVTIVVAGSERGPEPTDEDLRAAVADRVAGGSSTRDAVEDVANSFGVNRRRVYELARTGV